jgi:hypothetical protein
VAAAGHEEFAVVRAEGGVGYDGYRRQLGAEIGEVREKAVLRRQDDGVY